MIYFSETLPKKTLISKITYIIIFAFYNVYSIPIRRKILALKLIHLSFLIICYIILFKVLQKKNTSVFRMNVKKNYLLVVSENKHKIRTLRYCVFV